MNVEQLLYRASKFDCDVCPFKMRCCPKEPARKIPRSIYEDARDAARALGKTEAFEQSCRDRKRVEMLFAHLKRILRLGRLRLRGPRGAQDEFTLAAIAQNLRRLGKFVARPPPGRCVRCVSVACVGECVAAAVPSGAHGKQQDLTPSSRPFALFQSPTSATKSALNGKSLQVHRLSVAGGHTAVAPTDRRRVKMTHFDRRAGAQHWHCRSVLSSSAGVVCRKNSVP